jgi:hypothetical protein
MGDVGSDFPVFKFQIFDAGEFAGVMRDKNQSMNNGDGGNHEVIGTNRSADPAKFRPDFAIFPGCIIK